MKVVSVINIKGGVGKTTLTANLGAELASRGYRVLLIDLDPQASLTFSFVTIDQWNSELATDRTIKRWFDRKNEDLPLASLIMSPTMVKEMIDGRGGALDLIPSHLGLVNIDIALAASLGGGTYEHSRENYMKVHRSLALELRTKPMRRYDVVLIDCAPNLNVLNKSALIASDGVLIPAKADHLSTLGIEYLVRHLKGLVTDYNAFTRTRPADGPRIPAVHPRVLGVVFSMIQYRSNQPIQAIRSFIEEVEKLEVTVFANMVRQNTSLFAVAPRDGVPVSVKNSVPADLAKELDDLATEFAEKAQLVLKGSS